MAALSIPALSASLPFAGALGVNLGLVKCIDLMTADMDRMPGSGQIAEVLLVTLAGIVVFTIVRDLRAKSPWLAGRAKHLAILCLAAAFISLFAYRTLASIYIIKYYPPALSPIQSDVPENPEQLFLRPVFVRGPATHGDPLRPTVQEYLATWSGQGGWQAAVELDADGLNNLIDEQDPLARPLTSAAFVGVYGVVMVSLTLGMALAWPQACSRSATGGDPTMPGVEVEGKPALADQISGKSAALTRCQRSSGPVLNEDATDDKAELQ